MTNETFLQHLLFINLILFLQFPTKIKGQEVLDNFSFLKTRDKSK